MPQILINTCPAYDTVMQSSHAHPLRQAHHRSPSARSPAWRARVDSGRYGSLSEVVRAALHALEREEQALDAILKARVEEALADPASSIPQSDVFAALGAHSAKRSAKSDNA